MLPGLLGRKVGMTHVFDDAGRMVPVSVIEAGPCFVTQIKNPERDGYSAVQLGFGLMPRRKTTKPMQGHFKAADVDPARHLREFRVSDTSDIALGQKISVELFDVGERIVVSGTSKGRGFAGAMKRHGFHGQTATHGFMTHRRPCSAGATGPARVFKGKKGPGHMGAERVSQRGLRVVAVDADRNLLLVSGSVPGANGGIVEVRKEARS
jgi:large subunit ribosomal protein L3